MVDSACIFCRIAARDIPADIVHESDPVVAFRDANPQAPTHILIIPKEHVESVAELEDGTAALLADIAQAADPARARRGDRRVRLAPGDERGARRRPERVPPPFPPARWAPDGVAPGLSGARMGAAAGEGGRRRQEGTGPPPRENSHVAGATTQVKILVPGNQSMVALLGQRDVFLKIIESAFDSASSSGATRSRSAAGRKRPSRSRACSKSSWRCSRRATTSRIRRSVRRSRWSRATTASRATPTSGPARCSATAC